MKLESPEGLREFYEKDYVRELNRATIPQDDDFMYSQVLHQIRPYLKPGMKVLDLGCNNGNLSLYMANFGCEVLGIDIASNAIELAKQSADFYGISNARFESMDFISEWDKPGVFDFVLCSHIIEHIPRDDLFLQKISFATKPKGRLVLFTPTNYSSLVFISKLFTGRFAYDEEVGHLRRYTREMIRDLMEINGFKINRAIFLDGALREWFILYKPLRPFNKIWARRYVRSLFNFVDTLLAPFFFPSAICVHAQQDENGGLGSQ